MALVEIAENQVWKGKGKASDQRIRILRVSLDRQKVTFERLAGAPDHALHKEVRSALANIEAAFEYAGETLDTFL